MLCYVEEDATLESDGVQAIVSVPDREAVMAGLWDRVCKREGFPSQRFGMLLSVSFGLISLAPAAAPFRQALAVPKPHNVCALSMPHPFLELRPVSGCG